MSEPRSPSADDVRSLLGAYALDAVDPDERAAVERLVATDPSAAAELAQLTAVAATLGDAVAGEPPAALRASVLAAIADVPQLGPLSGPARLRPDAPAGTGPLGSPASGRRTRRVDGRRARGHPPRRPPPPVAHPLAGRRCRARRRRRRAHRARGPAGAAREPGGAAAAGARGPADRPVGGRRARRRHRRRRSDRDPHGRPRAVQRDRPAGPRRRQGLPAVGRRRRRRRVRGRARRRRRHGPPADRRLLARATPWRSRSNRPAAPPSRRQTPWSSSPPPDRTRTHRHGLRARHSGPSSASVAAELDRKRRARTGAPTELARRARRRGRAARRGRARRSPLAVPCEGAPRLVRRQGCRDVRRRTGRRRRPVRRVVTSSA